MENWFPLTRIPSVSRFSNQKYAPRDFILDSEASLPTTLVAAGSRALCISERTFWVATRDNEWTETTGQGFTFTSYVAAVAIGGQRVIVTDSSGKAIYADNTNAAHADMAMKISAGAAGIGDIVTGQIIGQMTEIGWAWTPGGAIYVGTNGMMTQTPPTSPAAAFSKILAVAETATRLVIVNETPIILL